MTDQELPHPVGPLLGLSKVQAELSISESTVRRLITSGELRTLTIGRRRFVEREELARFLEVRRRTVRDRP
jgi:excisionase family DNA binding protein